MAVKLDHTIVSAHDSQAAATFLSEILGLDPPTRFGPFLIIEADNGVSLDFLDTDGEIVRQHYAFLIDEAEFEQIFARIQARQIPYWADPGKTRPGQINHGDGGRGFYFDDLNGHRLEVLTRRYGSSR
ncbi:MAG: VOC family protein [Azonexus sp.]